MGNPIRYCRILARGALAALLAAGAARQAAAQLLDVTYVPSEAVAAVVVRPQQLLTSPQAKLMPIEVFSAMGKQQAGIDPLDVEQAVIVIDKMRNPQAPPDFGIILRLSKPYQQGQIFPKLFAEAETVPTGGKSYLRGATPPLNALHLANDRTVLLASEPMMQQMLAATEPAGHLPMLLEKTNVEHHITAVFSVDAMRAEVNALLAQAKTQPIPPPFAQFLAVPEHLSAVALRTSLTDQFKLDMILLGRNEQSAQELERLAKLAVAMGQEAAANAAAQQLQKGEPGDPVAQATLQYTQRMTDYYAQMLQPKRNGRAVSVSLQADTGMTSMGLAMGLLLPAIQAARGSAQQMQSSNNLKQIGLAIHNFHDVNRQFPTDITDEKGTRLLSWRVRLLPYLEAGPLYEQIHQNEPWNSEHNLKLLAQMPATLKNPQIADPTATVYLAPRGTGTFGDDGLKKMSFADILDGTSNTIMVVEANAEKAVPWTKPADLDVDMQHPLAGLGGLRPNGVFGVLLGDGSVRLISKAVTPDLLWKLFTRAGGEPITDF